MNIQLPAPRWSAILFLAVIALDVLWPRPDPPGVQAPTVADLAAGAVAFDPCNMWEQVPAGAKFGTLFWISALAAMLVQGLRNRTVALWVSVLAFPAGAAMYEHNQWRLYQCYSATSFTWFWIDALAFCLLAAHQVLWRMREARTRSAAA